MLSEKEYDDIYQKGYEDGKNENKLIVEYAIKPSFTTRKLKEQQKEIERLNNIIKIMEKYFELIVDLGYDYDGLNKIEDLKTFIDELCRYASLGRVCNTTEPIFINKDKKYNILNEELKEGK